MPIKRFTNNKGTLTLSVRVSEEWAIQPATETNQRDGRELVVRMLLGLYRIVQYARLSARS
jgi:hypothetical protein